MKNRPSSIISEVRAEQVANEVSKDSNLYGTVVLPEMISLGIDLHKATVVLTRIIDHGTAQPAQSFAWDQFWKFVEKQLGQAKKVYAVYEAGAFGFWVARRLKAMGVECYVMHPEKLDPRQKRVQTDKLDSRHLADKLQRYVLGNKKAMTPVYIPTESEEHKRLEARHRRSLHEQRQALQRRGASLLLSQGIFRTDRWWNADRWAELRGMVCSELQRVLEDTRALMEELRQKLRVMEKKLKESAPAKLPKGLGRLTFVLLIREICNFERFKRRRSVGGFTGLCGGVSSSGTYHLDLSINKAGSGFLRQQLVESAWRMVFHQPNYRGLKVWNKLKEGGGTHRRRRKIAIVAVAHQLAIDLWKWQTGRVSPEELGWEMVTPV